MISKLERKDFDKVFRIMETSFPKDEYRTYEEQKALLDKPEYDICIMADSDGAIKAFMAVWNLDSFVFIEHFAVDPAYRNNGIGGEFLRKLAHSTRKMMCLEVELPDNEIASRRIGFYERNGFVLNKYPYMQPSISAGRNPVPLLIMTYGRYIDNTEFDRIKEVLYTEVYGVKVTK